LNVVSFIFINFIGLFGDDMELKNKHCVPCEGGEPPLTKVEEDRYIRDLEKWKLDRDGVHTIERNFKFKNFNESMEFVNKVADLAEDEGHHPDIKISWNKVELKLTTHAIDGLSENDFIMATKINGITD